MLWIRPRLALVASAWLAFQLCLFVSIPTALSPNTTASVGAECTCEHGDGQICPMHHSRSVPKGQGSHPCACRSTADPASTIAASLIGPAGVLTPAAATIAHATVTAALPVFAPAPLDSVFVPDSPPPRG